MANYNLTDQTISSSFEQLLQKNTDTGELVNGIGVVVSDLTVTSSQAISSSHSEISDVSSLLQGNAEQVSHIDFAVGGDATIERRLTWNDTDGTLNVGLKGGNVTLQVGQELVTRVVNKSGVNLLEANYQVVEIIGAQGQRLSVDLAQANGVSAQATLGLVTETINNNQEGFVTTNGIVRGIDTRGTLQGETWNEGDPLYLSSTTPGGLTNIPPTAPNQLVKLGFVLNPSPNGQIYVKIEVGTSLTQLYDVTVTTPQSGDVLKYNAGLELWENVPSANLTGSFVQDTTFNTYTSSNDSKVNTLISATGSYATTGSNSFVGVQTITGEISKFGGDYIDYVGGNIITFGGRVAGSAMGNTNGTSTHTGSFVGDGSGLTNIPLDGRYATTSSNTFIGDQMITGSVIIADYSGSVNYPLELQNPYFPSGKIQLGFFKGDVFDQAEVAFIAGNTSFQSTGNMAYSTNLTGDSANELSFQSRNIDFSSTGTGGTIQTNTNVKQNVTAADPFNQKDFVAVSNASVGGKAYTAMDFTLQDYGGDYEDVFVMEAYDGFSFNYGAEFALNGKQVRMESIPSGSGYNNRASVNVTDNYNGSSDVNIITRGSGKTVISGSVGISGSVTINQDTLLVQGPISSKSTITDNSIKTQDNFNLQSSLETAYGGKIGLANLLTNDDFGMTLKAEDWGFPPNWSGPAIYSNNPSSEYPAIIGFQNKTNWTDGRVTVLKPLIVSGSTTINGDHTTNGLAKQNVSAPTLNNQKDFISLSGVNLGGTPYNVSGMSIQDYGGDYEDTFAIEQFDSFGFNYGGGLYVNGKRSFLLAQPSGSGFGGRAEVRVVDNGDATADVELTALSGKVNVNGQLVLPGLGDYVDDAAAATGGVPVNGVYRTGNVLKIRVV